MASLRRIPGRKVWIACFTDANGRRRQKSTKSRDKRIAMKIASAWEEAARNTRTADWMRQVVEELAEEIAGTASPGQAVLSEYAELWLGQKRSEISDSTFSFYTSAVGKIAEMFPGKSVQSITRANVVKFRDTMAKGRRAGTANHYLRVFGMILRSAVSEGILNKNPSEFVKQVRKSNDTGRRAFTLDEIKKVLKLADPEWQSMIRFGLYTGQRLGDIVRLKWRDIDMKRGTVSFVTKKTGRDIVLPLTGPLLEHVRSMERGNAGEFVHPELAEMITPTGKVSTISRKFVELLAEVGLRKKMPHRKRGSGRSGKRELAALSFHSLRATATTMMHDAGVPPAVAQEFIGHDSKEVHRAYVKIGDESMRKAADSLPKI